MSKHVLAAAVLALMSSGAAFAGPLSVHKAVGLSIGENKVTAVKSNIELPSPPGQPSAVPLPAAGWMLLAGICGIVALRRRAKA
jgi:hypothetical protein